MKDNLLSREVLNQMTLKLISDMCEAWNNTNCHDEESAVMNQISGAIQLWQGLSRTMETEDDAAQSV